MRNKILITFLIFIVWSGLALFACGSIHPQHSNDNIILLMTKLSDFSYRLDWADLNATDCSPEVYNIYRSENPAVLGVKIATLHGTTYTDNIDGNPTVPKVLFYQVRRVNE